MKKIMPFLFFPLLLQAKTVSDFEGEYVYRHSLYNTSENSTVHNIEDIVKVQPVDDKKANIIVETFTQNFHSCQLIGEAELQGDVLIFKSSVDKKLNRGKPANCILKITHSKNANGEKIVTIEDDKDNCRLRYCGMTAELGGQFTQKNMVVQEKN